MARSYSDKFPIARSEGLLVERIGSESVVYDTESTEAHCLSPLAAAVFAHCDGRTRVDDLAKLAERRLGEPVGVQNVHEALAQLDERRLLAVPAQRITRRAMARKTAAATAAISAVPLVSSVITSAYASAASPGPECPRDRCSSQGSGDTFCNTLGEPVEDSCECEDCSALTALGIPCPPDTACGGSTQGGCEPGKRLDGLCVFVPGDT